METLSALSIPHMQAASWCLMELSYSLASGTLTQLTESSLQCPSLWCSSIFHDILQAGCGSAVYSLTEIVKSDQIPHQGQGLGPHATVSAPEDHYFFNSKPIQC